MVGAHVLQYCHYDAKYLHTSHSRSFKIQSPTWQIQITSFEPRVFTFPKIACLFPNLSKIKNYLNTTYYAIGALWRELRLFCLYFVWSLIFVFYLNIYDSEIFVFINTLLEIITKSTKNQQIGVGLGTAMTNFTEFVTSCKNQQFGAYFLSIRVVHWPNQQNSSKIEIFLESSEYTVTFWNLFWVLWNLFQTLGIFWNIFGILNTTKYCK